MRADRRRCAVLGSPIEHSLSPVLHRAAYAELGLDWTYDRFEVTQDRLADFVAGCDVSWRGLSLTMPLKLAVLPLGRPDDLVRLVGAANTLIFDADTRRLYNTDVGGLSRALQAAGVEGIERVTILGAGGTARSALLSVSQLGARDVTVMVRTAAKAEVLRPLADHLGLRLVVQEWDAPPPTADVLLSTVAASATDARAEEFAASAPLVFDVIYDPWPTRLGEAAAAAGCAVVNGLDLLVHQATEQVERMTGRGVDWRILMSAGREALTADGAA